MTPTRSRHGSRAAQEADHQNARCGPRPTSDCALVSLATGQHTKPAFGSPGHEGKRNVVALTPLGRVEQFEFLLNGGDPIPSFLDGLG
jgi:hypothetical protein